MIRLENLAFAYPQAPRVLEGVSFELPAGATMGLVGANGSGKSTLLSLLAGLYAPESGRITVGEIVSPGGEKRLRAFCGLVMQDADLQILGSTVAEDLALGLEGRKDLDRIMADMADRFALPPGSTPVQTLSYGQKRKLCLASALLREPGVLLLDEPFSGLDYPASREMRAILARNARGGLTQVVSAHDVEPLADLADFWAVLHKGRLALLGGVREVFDRLEEFGVRAPCAWRQGRTVVPWDGS